MAINHNTRDNLQNMSPHIQIQVIVVPRTTTQAEMLASRKCLTKVEKKELTFFFKEHRLQKDNKKRIPLSTAKKTRALCKF